MLLDEGFRTRGEIDDAEETHVFIREMRAVIEIEDDARESWLPILAVVREVTCHSEVQMQPLVSCIGEKVLAVAPNARELFAAQRTHEFFFSDVAEDALVADVDSCDGLL